MLCYKHFKTKEDWLKGRDKYPGIGASEAAAVVGISKWMTTDELWKIKMGITKKKSIDDNEYIQYGTKAEEHIRQLFMLKHEEFKLSYKPYDFLYQKERPWLRCTLDGELIHENGDKGILEVKTHFIRGKSDYAQWNDKIPDHYLVQILHQFLATQFEFAYLAAELISPDFSSQLKTYYFLARDYEEDMAWLLEQEENFWSSVLSGRNPNLILSI